MSDNRNQPDPFMEDITAVMEAKDNVVSVLLEKERKAESAAYRSLSRFQWFGCCNGSHPVN